MSTARINELGSVARSGYRPMPSVGWAERGMHITPVNQWVTTMAPDSPAMPGEVTLP